MVFQSTAGVCNQDARVVDQGDLWRVAGVGASVISIRHSQVDHRQLFAGVDQVRAFLRQHHCVFDDGVVTVFVAVASEGHFQVSNRGFCIADAERAGHGACDSGVFDQGLGRYFDHWQVINRRHRHVQRAARTGVGGVADLRHSTVVILGRVKHIRAIRTDGDGADTFDKGDFACGIRVAVDAKRRDRQHAVDVAVIAQHVASGSLILDNGVGVRDQHARIVDSDHCGSGGLRVDRQVFVVTAARTGDGGADGQVFAVG